MAHTLAVAFSGGAESAIEPAEESLARTFPVMAFQQSTAQGRRQAQGEER